MQTRGSANKLGLDISEYQTITDAKKLFADYPDYIYLRAFGSLGNVDAKFLERVALAKSYGVPSGAYYFSHPTKALGNGGEAEVDSQCGQFIDLLQQGYGAGKYGDLIPMLDVEAWGTTTPQHPMYDGITGVQLVAWVGRFRDRFFTKTNRRLGFYSNRDFLTNVMAITTAQLDPLKNMPLWLAEYDQWYPANVPDTGAPANLGGWTTYVLWQYGVIADANQHGLTHGQNQVDHDRTDSVDRIKPPSPPTYVRGKQTADNTITVYFIKPPITDYIGSSLYINGVWKKWIVSADSQTTFDITPYARNQDIAIQVVAEDSYSDFGYSDTKTLKIFPTFLEAEAYFMPTIAMGTTLKKGTTVTAGLTSIGGLDLSADTLDTTTLSSVGGYRSFIGSFKDAGDVSISGYFEGSSHLVFYTDFEAGTANGYTITFPDGTIWGFSAVVTGFTTGADLEDLISFEATLKVSGKPTLTIGTP
jgi:predicted secreted protein/GH25 family lysozyme M1 (1,4-beta-N-acetylmuramidase)